MSQAGSSSPWPGWLRTDASPLDQAQVLTLLLLLSYGRERGFLFLEPVAVAVLFAGLIWPLLRKSVWFWFAVTGFVLIARIPEMLFMENHHYLIAYWCIALVACRLASADDPEPAIAQNAKWLVGLAMVLAVVAKLRWGEFANGAFFEYLLLTEPRFDAFSQILAGVPEQVLQANRAARASLSASGTLGSVALAGRDQVALVAQLLSLWTLLIEAAVAFFFLLPQRPAWAQYLSGLRWWAAARHASLIGFAITTYAVVTVVGFAWILLILGLAHCRREEVAARTAYCAAFLLVLVYTLPWGAWLLPLLTG